MHGNRVKNVSRCPSRQALKSEGVRKRERRKMPRLTGLKCECNTRLKKESHFFIFKKVISLIFKIPLMFGSRDPRSSRWFSYLPLSCLKNRSHVTSCLFSLLRYKPVQVAPLSSSLLPQFTNTYFAYSLLVHQSPWSLFALYSLLFRVPVLSHLPKLLAPLLNWLPLKSLPVCEELVSSRETRL